MELVIISIKRKGDVAVYNNVASNILSENMTELKFDIHHKKLNVQMNKD